MSLSGGNYVWEESGKYYHSTAPYRQYGVEITFTEFAAKKLEGAEEAQEMNYSWQGTIPSWTTAPVYVGSGTTWTGYTTHATTNTI